jgi:hypothetical protein
MAVADNIVRMISVISFIRPAQNTEGLAKPLPDR